MYNAEINSRQFNNLRTIFSRENNPDARGYETHVRSPKRFRVNPDRSLNCALPTRTLTDAFFMAIVSTPVSSIRHTARTFIYACSDVQVTTPCSFVYSHLFLRICEVAANWSRECLRGRGHFGIRLRAPSLFTKRRPFYRFQDPLDCALTG